MNTPEEFDRNWTGPSELKPRVYRRQIEKDIWYGCVVENEYNLPALKPEDVVIDIGAHIGAFSFLAHYRGSRNIYAYEIDSWHCEAAKVNTQGLNGYHQYHAAVVRSDKPALNRKYDGRWDIFTDAGTPIAAFSLNTIIEGVGPIRFLKTDCEGSEWPILYTCTMLNKVQEICGEYHAKRGAQLEAPELTGLPPCEPETLARFLLDWGFDEVSYSLENEGGLGLFNARRAP